MTYILHIDTSAHAALVALSGDGRLLASRHNAEARTHATVLNQFAEDVLRECNLAFSDLSAIAVCGGPGSYTGLRIAMSAAKGWCYALDIPLMVHNRLLLLLLPHINNNDYTQELFMAVLPAREQEYFAAIYHRNLQPFLAPCHLNQEELEKTITDIKNDLLAIFANEEKYMLNINNVYFPLANNINSDSWMTYSYSAYNMKDFVNADYAEPLYLKSVYTHNKLKSN